MQSPLPRRTFLQHSAALGLSSLSAQQTHATPEPGDIAWMSAFDAARWIRRGSSPYALTQEMLRRVEKHNPRVNALCTVDHFEALKRANEATDAARRDEWWGPWHGVPITIKDSFETKGLRTTIGSRDYADYIPERDATIVARAKAAGAIVLGKTNTPAWAGDWQTHNDLFGITNNPWDLARTPGGSTGGGAAAVAAGLSFLSIGSDWGGSIRTPAHFCGLFGHKPSLGVLPLSGHLPPPPDDAVPPPPKLATPGVLARSATDLMTAMEVLGGPEDDAVAYEWRLPKPRAMTLVQYRVGYMLDDPFCPVLDEVAGPLHAAIEALKPSGAFLNEGWPTDVSPQEQYDTYLFHLYSAYAGEKSEDDIAALRERVARETHPFWQKRLDAYGATLKDAYAFEVRRLQAIEAWKEYFRHYDVFLCPVTFNATFPHNLGEDRTFQTEQGPRLYQELGCWISFATLCGLPATVAPVGVNAQGLPVGIQVIGPPLEDATAIDFAGKLTALVDGYKRPEGFW